MEIPDSESLLIKHKSLIAKYAKKFQIDLSQDEPIVGSSIKSKESAELTNQNLENFKTTNIPSVESVKSINLRKSFEDEVIIQSENNEKNEEIKSPIMKGMQTEPVQKNTNINIFEIDESVNVDKFIEKYKAKKLQESVNSSSTNSIPKVSLNDSIEEILKKYGTVKLGSTQEISNSNKKATPEPTLSKSQEDIDQFLNKLKSQLISASPPKKNPEKIESNLEPVKEQTKSPPIKKTHKKKSPKMPPKMQLSMSTEEVQRKLRDSLKRKSLEELVTQPRYFVGIL